MKKVSNMPIDRHTILPIGEERCSLCGKVRGHKLVCEKCGGVHSTEMHDIPRRGTACAVFEPSELGYLCPKKHRASNIQWSEFKEHIWCCVCEKDYPSKDCLLQIPDYWTETDWEKHIKGLPFKANVLPGVLKTEDGEWR